MSQTTAADGFLGRARELGALKAAWAGARGGDGGLVAVRGEAGIGKTRLATELSKLAADDGGRVLWGRAQEIAGAPPYWPWIEVIRSLLTDSPAAPAGERPHGRAEAMRLVPELSASAPAPDRSIASGDPERARWQLFEGVSTFLWSAAADRPTAIVLDDLHWADHATTLLMQHFARGIAGRPILLVAMYRGESLTDGHPLSAALAALGRLPGFERIELGGLSEDEVATYFRRSLTIAPSADTIRAVAERTGGNPFFVRELAASAERTGNPEELVSGLPHGVREAAAARLGVAAAETRDVLSWAALLGEEFAVPDLVTASERPRADVLEAIEDAGRAGLIVELPREANYRFHHALTRDALIARLTIARRAELHAAIAARFEAALSAPAHPARLAHHYTEAAELAPELTPRAIEYQLAAGEAAGRVSAWGEASAHFERALNLARRDPALPAAREAELLRALAGAAHAAGRWVDSHQHYQDAIERYRRADERLEMARTTLAWLSPSAQLPAPGERRQLAEAALSVLGSDDEALRARLLTELITTADEIPDAAALAAEARSLARVHELPDIDARLARWEAYRLYGQQRWDDFRARLLEAAQKFSEAGERLAAVNTALTASAVPLFQGRFDEAIELVTANIAAADRDGDAVWAARRRAMLATMEMHRGDRAGARGLLQSAPLGPREDGQFAITLAFLAELEGDMPRARQILDDVPEGVTWPEAALPAARARLSLIEGDESEARRQFAKWEPLFEKVRFHTLGMYSMGCLEAAVTLPPPHRRQELLEQAATWDGLHYAARNFDRVRGLLALSLDRVDAAERHFCTGRDWALRERCEAEAGRCELNLADVAAARGRNDDAVRLVESALSRLRRAGVVLEVRGATERLAQLRGAEHGGGGMDELTARERDVLQHIASGKTNPQIAELLTISPHTVANHLKSILAKTGCANRVEAAVYALAHDLAEPGGTGT